jgi:hypothetical protein
MSGIIGGAGSKSGVIGETEIDYEEGTWTPTITGGTFTKTQQSANYIKVGKLVTITSYWEGNNNGDATGLEVGGLPFTSKGNNTYTLGCLNYSVSNSGETADCTVRVVPSNTTLYFSRNPQVTLPQTSIDAAHFIFSLTYFSA